MDLTPLRNDPASFSVMLATAQKARSIAAEGEYLDLLETYMSPLTLSVKAVDVLADLAMGERTIDDSSFNTLCQAWRLEHTDVGLVTRGYELP